MKKPTKRKTDLIRHVFHPTSALSDIMVKIKKYEYKMVSNSTLPKIDTVFYSFEENKKVSIKKLGEQGWELCAIQAENSCSGWKMYFKREIIKP